MIDTTNDKGRGTAGNDKEDYLDTCDPLCLALNNGVKYGKGGYGLYKRLN